MTPRQLSGSSRWIWAPPASWMVLPLTWFSREHNNVNLGVIKTYQSYIVEVNLSVYSLSVPFFILYSLFTIFYRHRNPTSPTSGIIQQSSVYQQLSLNLQDWRPNGLRSQKRASSKYESQIGRQWQSMQLGLSHPENIAYALYPDGQFFISENHIHPHRHRFLDRDARVPLHWPSSYSVAEGELGQIWYYSPAAATRWYWSH